MAESNNEWGELAAYDKELADAWDGFDTLPDPGENLVLDSFIERKHLSHQALLRLGARLSGEDTLVFAYDKGMKFRNMITGRMWSRIGSEWPHMKIVRAGTQPTERVIVCEGETDGARLAMLYDQDVAIMPAGARYFPETMAEQLEPYMQVLVALDKDEAGEEGSALVADACPQSVRFPAPGDGDWSDVTTDQPIPDLPELTATEDDREDALPVLVAAGTLLELDVPDIYSWFEHALLPVGGQAIIHGREKSFKTYQALDMLAALAQGEPWCGFEPTEEACRVAVMQFEISWPYYHQRIQQLRNFAANKELFDENFLTWTPLQRPRLVAGDTKAEDHVLSTLVEGNVQVILVDPIRRAAGFADLNAENEVRKILRFFERLQDAGITVVATHHDNKEGARNGGGSTLHMTGSGAFGGDADTLIGIELPHGEDENSPHRNINFMLRNAPAIGPRSFEMTEDGQLIYDTEPFYAEAEPTTGAEAVIETPLPSI
jgi:hypothetical protein